MSNKLTKLTSEKDIDAKIKEISRKIEKTTPIERAVQFNESLKRDRLQNSKIKIIFKNLFGES